MKTLEEIVVEKKIIAKIIHTESIDEEVLFFTDFKDTLQTGLQNRKKNTHIKPHKHPNIQEFSQGAKEVIYIIEGAVEISLFDSKNIFLDSCILKTGDLFIQFSNAHSFQFLENTKFIEIKRGSYAKDLSIKTVNQS